MAWSLGAVFDRLLGWLKPPVDPSPPPPNDHPASSFHLWWRGLDAGPAIVEASVVLEVLRPPAVDELYFWAMQVTLRDGAREAGGAHIGLQWNPKHPGSTAVNWGGYANIGDVTSVLGGSDSDLPSEPNDPNTRDYPWRPGQTYRLRVVKVLNGWRGEVDDIDSGVVSIIRTLDVGGDRLDGLVMWAEVFAPCDAPPTVARWTSPQVRDANGRVYRPTAVGLTFPGRCTNTDVADDGTGLLQFTSVARTARDGDVLAIPRASI